MAYLKVIATPGARREKVEEKARALHIAVKEPAEQNRANMRVREIVAARLGVPVAQVKIINGHHGHSKLLSVPD